MKLSALTPLAAGAILVVAPFCGHAAVSAYSQNFEGLNQASPTALGEDGWNAYGNVLNLDGSPSPIGGYYVGPSPNGGPGFSAIVSGKGGAAQGNQQLTVYSNYNDSHQATNRIEAVVYQEQSISAADAGKTWTFEFDAKLGRLVPDSTAYAFIQTIDPAAGYAKTSFMQLQMTTIPAAWNRYSVSLPVDASHVGQLLQFGFTATATNFTPSSNFYDNLSLAPVPEPQAFALMFAGLGLVGAVARRRSKTCRA